MILISLTALLATVTLYEGDPHDYLAPEPDYDALTNRAPYFGMGGWTLSHDVIHPRLTAYEKLGLCSPLRRLPANAWPSLEYYDEQGLPDKRIYTVNALSRDRKRLLRLAEFLRDLDAMPDLDQISRSGRHPKFSSSCRAKGITMKRVDAERIKTLRWLRENADLTHEGWSLRSRRWVPDPSGWLTQGRFY